MSSRSSSWFEEDKVVSVHTYVRDEDNTVIYFPVAEDRRNIAAVHRMYVYVAVRRCSRPGQRLHPEPLTCSAPTLPVSSSRVATQAAAAPAPTGSCALPPPPRPLLYSDRSSSDRKSCAVVAAADPCIQAIGLGWPNPSRSVASVRAGHRRGWLDPLASLLLHHLPRHGIGLAVDLEEGEVGGRLEGDEVEEERMGDNITNKIKPGELLIVVVGERK